MNNKRHSFSFRVSNVVKKAVSPAKYLIFQIKRVHNKYNWWIGKFNSFWLQKEPKIKPLDAKPLPVLKIKSGLIKGRG
ncbi:MAG: hypothetical protein ACJAUY_001655 [Cognaticolwellia sp.]